MTRRDLRVTYVGGPTLLLEVDGVRFLTDPTFDPAGGHYPSGASTLHKLAGPAIGRDELDSFDYVLLSHDHHFDNLDHAGRELLPKAKQVLTTAEGAQRIGGNSVGLKDWQSIDLPASTGVLRVIATPARHGPAGLIRGAVTGFVLENPSLPEKAIYISGDTVWYEGVAEIAQRYPLRVAILHLGAARVPEVGPFHLTMTAAEGIAATRTFQNALIVPVHFEGWAHFSEGRNEIAAAFDTAGLAYRLCWPVAARSITLEL